jgi:thiol-disulfide isomerase/thioredoxin
MKKYLFFSLFFLFSSVSNAQETSSLSHLLNTQAQVFNLKTIKGKKYSLSKLKGKTIVINYWFPACSPCVREIPDLNQVVEKYKNNKNVVFLAISVVGNEEVVTQFVKRKKFEYQIVATDFTLAKKQGIQLYPTNLIIDKTGKITFAVAGYKDNIKDLLIQEIEKALK